MADKTRPVFDNIGRFRLEEPKTADLLPCKPLGPRKNGDARAESFVKPPPTFEDLEMADEWDDEEATALYPLLPGQSEHPDAAYPRCADPIGDDLLDELLADDGGFAGLTPPRTSQTLVGGG